VPRQIEPDEPGDRLDVLIEAPELLPLSGEADLLNPVPTGSMNTMSVRSSQLYSLSTTIRGRGHSAVGEHRHAFRTEHPEVEPHRGGAGPAVERES
jgi:hypothetical protein